MNIIKSVSFLSNLGKTSRVFVEFNSGKKAYFDIRANADGVRKIISDPKIISQEEIAAVKAVAKIDGKWTEYGDAAEQSRRNGEIIDLVKSRKFEYTYDRNGEITGCVEIKSTESNLFDSAHGIEG